VRDRTVEIPMSLFNALLNYLASRPFREVNALIMAMADQEGKAHKMDKSNDDEASPLEPVRETE